MREEMAVLDRYIAPGLRLWMLMGLVFGLLLVMVVIVCCFIKIRIPRTKRQIELIAAKKKMRKAKARRITNADQQADELRPEIKEIRMNSLNNGRKQGDLLASRSIPV